MKTKALVPVVVSSLGVEDSSALLSVTQSQATAANLIAAVGHRNVTTMQALVQELADESVNEPAWKFDKDIQDALKAIRNMFVKSIQSSVKDAHREDQNDMNEFTETCFGDCVKEYEQGYAKCEAQTKTCNEKADAHATCRKDVYEKYKEMGKACGALHCWEVPDVKCDPEVCTTPAVDKCHTKMQVSYGAGDGECEPEIGSITVSSDKVGGPWLRAQLGKFERAQVTWKGMHQKCQAAYAAFLTADMSCDAEQKEFETCLCTKNECEARACNIDYDQCETLCWEEYELKVKRKECLEKDRKIDWSATKKIECYIDVLLHDYSPEELLSKCGDENCINKAREEDYKNCAKICPHVDYDGDWPEVDYEKTKWPAPEGYANRTAIDQYHLGDGHYKFDANGPLVFTKHRSARELSRSAEGRCTEHLDIDYQIPKCIPCHGPPPPVCDAAFHKKWYKQFDDTEKIGCISDCCSDFTDDSKSPATCFTAENLLSSQDGDNLQSLTIHEHSHAWAYNRCPCTACTKTPTPDYGPRPAGRQCGNGAHTISPGKVDKVEYKNLCISAKGGKFASIDIEKSINSANDVCIKKMTFTHKSGLLSCRTQETGNSNWGCDMKSIGLVVTDSSNTLTAPAFDTAVGMTPHYSKHAPWYELDGVHHDSKEMSLLFKQPYYFASGEYKLWYGEDLTGGTEGDNRGEACFDLALETTQLCKALAPLQFHEVCVSANGDAPHTITLPAHTHVSKIDIHHISGEVSCRKEETGNSKFGCDSNAMLGLVWTKTGEKDVIMPLEGQVVGVTETHHDQAHWYKMANVNADSRTLSMVLKKPVEMVGSFDLWYNEDLTGWTEGDNSGEACYEVTVHRDI